MFFFVSNVTVKPFFLNSDQCFFVYFSLFQDTWWDRQSFGTLFFEMLGTVIRDKQRSNKMQLEKKNCYFGGFHYHAIKNSVKSKPWNV